MKVYRRLRSRIIVSSVWLLIAVALGGFVFGLIFRNLPLAAAISGGVFLLGTLALFLFRHNVRFELEVGRLRCYKNGRLRGNYFLSTCKFRTHIDCDYDRHGNVVGRPGLELFVSDVSDYSGDEIRLDLTPIGLARFQELIDELRLYYEKAAERNRQRQ